MRVRHRELVVLLGVLVVVGALYWAAASVYRGLQSDKHVDVHTPELIEGKAAADFVASTAPKLHGSAPVKPPLPADRTRIHVDLLLPDHTPAPGGVVFWWTDDEPMRKTASWTPLHPRIEVGKGTVWLQASRRTLRPSEPVQIDSTATQSVSLRLQGDAGVRGRVELPPGWLATRASVLLFPFEGEDPPVWELVMNRSKVKTTHVRRLEPTYVFRRLKPGRYLLMFTLGERIEQSTVVEVTDHEVVHDFRIVAPPADQFTPLVIRGVPRASVRRLSFRSHYHRHRPAVEVTVIPTTEGPWLMRLGPAFDERNRPIHVDHLRHELAVRLPGTGTVSIPYRPGQKETVEVAFNNLVDVEIQFEHAKSPGMLVGMKALVNTPRSQENREARLNTKGICKFERLLPGPYKLQLRAPYVVELYDIEVRLDEPRIHLVVPSLYRLTIEALESPAKLSLTRRRGDARGWGRPIVHLNDGTYAFIYVAAGSYQVEGMYGGERRTWDVDVTGDRTVRLDE